MIDADCNQRARLFQEPLTAFEGFPLSAFAVKFHNPRLSVTRDDFVERQNLDFRRSGRTKGRAHVAGRIKTQSFATCADAGIESMKTLPGRAQRADKRP